MSVTENGNSSRAPVQAPGAAAPAKTGVAGFGRLEPVAKLRDYWPDEAQHFTPWLARNENLALLGDAIGMNLEFVEKERYVGPYRADIIARDEDVEVIIENQLEVSNHRHLGQLLLYAANLGSGVIVWVARQVTDEHRKVINWLNERTDVRFYALEIELWRIGDSPVAPKFNVVCEPIELDDDDELDTSGEPSGTKALQLEYWRAFVDYMTERDSPLPTPKVAGRSWLHIRFGTSNGLIALTALRSGRIGCELSLRGAGADVIFNMLASEKRTIEAEVGEGELVWDPNPGKARCSIGLSKTTEGLENREQWAASREWMLNLAEKFHDVFAARVKAVVLPDPSLIAAPEPVEAAPEPA